MGVIGVQSMGKDAVCLAECNLENSWLCFQHNAVECFYSLEYVEAVFSFREEIIDNVESVGCLFCESSG